MHTVISALLHVRWLCAVREVAAVGRGVVGAHVCVWLATVHLGPSPLPSLPPSLRTPGVCIQQWVVCTVRGSEYGRRATTCHPWALGPLDAVDMGIMLDLARRFPVDAGGGHP